MREFLDDYMYLIRFACVAVALTLPAFAYDQLVAMPSAFHSILGWIPYVLGFDCFVLLGVYFLVVCEEYCNDDALLPAVFMNLAWLTPLAIALLAKTTRWFGIPKIPQVLMEYRFRSALVILGLWAIIAVVYFVKNNWPRWAQSALDMHRKKHKAAS
jgi:hypothetical protein